jgi:predicted alpha/beta-hydrolase family hydrolase
MEQAAQALASVGLHVYRFNFQFIERPRPPDRMPKLLAELEEVLTHWKVDGPRLVGGKSLGARVTLEVANRFDGWLALGYPFHPPSQPEKTRLDGFSRLDDTPSLIVQGTRDPFGRPQEVEGYGLSTPIHWIEGGDHAFLGCPRPFEQLQVAVQEWLDKVLPTA